MKCLIKSFLFISFVVLFIQTNIFSQKKSSDNPCSNLTKIKSIPYKPSDVDKTEPMYQNYFALLDQGEAAIPCLLDNITNTAEIEDPHCPSLGIIAVGDVAYFILYRIGGFGFTEMFSEDIQQAFKEDGMNGYYSLIDENGNRLKLQTKLKEWYSSKDQANK
jgi:hypothetical protein